MPSSASSTRGDRADVATSARGVARAAVRFAVVAHASRRSRSSSSGPVFVMSPAPIVSTTSPLATAARERVGELRALAAPRERAAGGVSASAIERRRHAGNRLLARRIDLGEEHGVRRGERRAELAREVARAREEVRLKRGDESALGIRDARRRRASRATSVGMMRVVVDDHDAAALAQPLEAALDAGERREARAPSPATVGAERQARCEARRAR